MQASHDLSQPCILPSACCNSVQNIFPFPFLHKVLQIKIHQTVIIGKISGSHCGEYEDDCLLGCFVV
jgi:hypothetical protein